MTTFDPSKTTPLYSGPRFGGRLKVAPEDFEVRELPEGELEGSGEHLYIWLEKTSVSTEKVVAQLAEQLGVARETMGYAGLKDTHAIAQQHISVPANVESKVADVDIAGVRILDMCRHTHRLRAAHSRGNAFRVRVRELSVPISEALARAETWCAYVADTGWPNYFGAQRFGRGGSTWSLGQRVYSGEVALGRLGRFERRLSLSALQGGIFNAYLQDRLRDELLTTVVGGDVLEDRRSGYLFATGIDDVDEHQQRLCAKGAMITGPLFGVKMRRPARDAAKREAELMERFGVTFSELEKYVKLAPGARRSLHRWTEVEVEVGQDSLVFSFELPPGAYATVLLGELCDFAVP